MRCQLFAIILCLLLAGTQPTFVKPAAKPCNCSLASAVMGCSWSSLSWSIAHSAYCHGAYCLWSAIHRACTSGGTLPRIFLGGGRPWSSGAGVVKQGTRASRARTLRLKRRLPRSNRSASLNGTSSKSLWYLPCLVHFSGFPLNGLRSPEQPQLMRVHHNRGRLMIPRSAPSTMTGEAHSARLKKSASWWSAMITFSTM